MGDRLGSMLASQLKLQRASFGHEFNAMTTAQRIDYIRINVLALTAELHELLDEMSWKPWATGERFNEDAAFKELIDAWHFLMNIALAIHTGRYPEQIATEWERRYDAKHAVNAQRQRDGYDGVSTKCAGCGRALEDAGVLVGESGTYSCGVCVAEVLPEVAALLGVRPKSTVVE